MTLAETICFPLVYIGYIAFVVGFSFFMVRAFSLLWRGKDSRSLNLLFRNGCRREGKRKVAVVKFTSAEMRTR